MGFQALDLGELDGVVGGETTGAGLNQDTYTGPNGTTVEATDNYGLCMRKAESSCDASTRWGPFGWFRDSAAKGACVEQQRTASCSRLPGAASR
jgi:hypothetical protein